MNGPESRRENSLTMAELKNRLAKGNLIIEKLISVKKAAEELNCSEQKVRRMIARREIVSCKIRACRRIAYPLMFIKN